MSRRTHYTPKSAWNGVDWRMTNKEIGFLVGVGAGAVTYQRQRRGIRQRQGRPDSVEWATVDWNLPAKEIARQRGVTVQAVTFQRRKRKKLLSVCS